MNTPKPGWQTTEYWLTLAAVVVGLLTASGAIPTDSTLGKGVALVAAALAAAGYSWSRGNVKAAAITPPDK